MIDFGIDFAEEWRQGYSKRRRPDSAQVWDKRASEQVTKYGPSDYSEEFLDLAQLQPGDTVFDMGCGAGALAIPCAQRGHRVVAADFSGVMLERLHNGVPQECADLVETKQLAWGDDWQAAGIAARSFDVACASRSIITDDLEDSLSKLTAVARRRVCVTVTAGASPRVFKALFRDLGLTGKGHQDAAFVFGVLTQMGYEPEVRFIRSSRVDRFASPEDAVAAYTDMLEFTAVPLSPDERREAERGIVRWLDEHLSVDDGSAASADEIRSWTRPNPEGVMRLLPYRVDVPRAFSWAFISWEPLG